MSSGSGNEKSPKFPKYPDPILQEVFGQYEKKFDVAEELAARAKNEDKLGYLRKSIRYYRLASNYYLEAIETEPETIQNRNEVVEKARENLRRAQFLQQCLDFQERREAGFCGLCNIL